MTFVELFLAHLPERATDGFTPDAELDAISRRLMLSASSG
jgi:hypothetical protein